MTSCGRDPDTCETCRDCSHLQHRYKLNGATLGECTNCESDHFGHIITSYHPACGKQH